jgi:hypothetical protein
MATYSITSLARANHRHFAKGPLWNARAFPASLRLDANELDHLGPFLGFVGDVLPEIGGEPTSGMPP